MVYQTAESEQAMPFQKFYHGEPQDDAYDLARQILRDAYEGADEAQKAEIEKSFNEKMKDMWPPSGDNQAAFINVVNEIVRELSASGI